MVRSWSAEGENMEREGRFESSMIDGGRGSKSQVAIFFFSSFLLCVMIMGFYRWKHNGRKANDYGLQNRGKSAGYHQTMGFKNTEFSISDDLRRVKIMAQ